jgi:hypothetical protein
LVALGMNAQREQSIEGGGLRVRFEFRVDRFAHEIGLVDDASWTPVFQSVDPPAAEDWPCSPPLQTLHIEERADGNRIAFLVGMAGQSHWSLSAELDAKMPRLTFDVACRLSSKSIGTLGSDYRSMWPSGGRQGSTARFRSNDRPLDDLVITADERRVATNLEITLDGARITPVMVPDLDSSRTIRWRYMISRAARSA